jgi:5-methylcytosine-specific restriction protein A
MRAEKLPIPENVRRFVFKRDNYTCRYCGDRKGPFHADHVYPESRGGETSVNNLVTSCGHCNHSKHASVGMWPKPIGYFDRPAKTGFDWITAFSILALVIMLVYTGFVLGLGGL